ncbi:hypothetical protein AYO44_12355 [Planctomycetaceae bacterium SCGC AG-212-F19]|nr:hypothetical protein AYO44_12355 [Planctomycetaceae bacterium SCGC AG-212-F19]
MPAPANVAPIFQGLHTDLVGLQVRWLMYRQLFGTSQERVELLNRRAPAYFGIAQATLLDDVLSGIARITDKTVVCGKDNLVLRQMIEELDEATHATEIAALEAKQAAVAAAVGPITTIRHKRLSHRDMQFALNPTAHPLPPIDRQQVEEALAAIADFMNTFQILFGEEQYQYAETVTELGNGDALIRHLQRAEAHLELEKTGAARPPRLSAVEAPSRSLPLGDAGGVRRV